MNCRYEIEVTAVCPLNAKARDRYLFTIESAVMIEVEKIAAFFKARAGKRKVFQEALTEECARTLGARVRSEGWHSGVKVICEAQ